MLHARVVKLLLCGFVCAAVAACAPASRPAPAQAGTVAAVPPANDAPKPAPITAPRGLEYVVRVDAELSRLSIELCFEGDAPPRLVYGSQPSAGFLLEPLLISEAGAKLAVPRALTVAAGLIELDAVKPDACVSFRVDLKAARESPHSLVAYPCERGLLTSTELFLWRPPRRPAGMTARLRFELPEGVGVSVPWREQDGVYALDETAFAFTGHALFGSFQKQQVAAPSAMLSIVTPPGFSEAQRGQIATWVANAAQVVSLATGRFPVDAAQVIVVPTPGFRFGHTGRSGGASILFLLPSDVELADLRADWIAVHEFSHLLHPFVQREDAWLSEGLATYLQEVLRVRAGMLDAHDAWRRLYEGAALGRDAPGDLRSETRRMQHAANYQTVYWAGAAIALMIDVELRTRSQGKVSLDVALTGLSNRPEFMQRPASAQSLLAALDAAVSGQTCHDVAQRYLTGRELPDLRDLYGRLGLLETRPSELAAGVSPREVQRNPRADAPLAWVAAAIMAEAPQRAELPFGG